MFNITNTSDSSLPPNVSRLVFLKKRPHKFITMCKQLHSFQILCYCLMALTAVKTPYVLTSPVTTTIETDSMTSEFSTISPVTTQDDETTAMTFNEYTAGYDISQNQVSRQNSIAQEDNTTVLSLVMGRDQNREIPHPGRPLRPMGIPPNTPSNGERDRLHDVTDVKGTFVLLVFKAKLSKCMSYLHFLCSISTLIP